MVLPFAALVAAASRFERLRPLLLGVAFIYVSFPLFYAISRLPVSYELRILLQVLAYAAMVFAVLLAVMQLARAVRRGGS